ncbi:MAG: orotate phosphoribosyltransferase [Coriobacteriia bacterium]|nr:orotate phosphoribosyltransferase [Coriobacteriia bacterium]
MLTDAQIYDSLIQTNALRKGHFQLTSGRHSDTYVQCARVLEDPTLTLELAKEAVARLPKDIDIDVVAAPAVGGILIGFAVAQALGKRFIFSERQNGEMVFRRSFELAPGTKVLVVEDVVTTGGSVAEVIKLVEEAGAQTVGVVSLIDRGGDKKFTADFWPLLTLEVASWDRQDCRLCKDGVDIYSPGSRRLTK